MERVRETSVHNVIIDLLNEAKSVEAAYAYIAIYAKGAECPIELVRELEDMISRVGQRFRISTRHIDAALLNLRRQASVETSRRFARQMP